MQTKAKTTASDRRARGDGQLFVRENKAGASWYGSFYVDGKRYMRLVGPAKPSSGALTQPQAEAAFTALRMRVAGEAVEVQRERERSEAEERAKANDRTIAEVGDALIAEKTADGCKLSTRESYRSALDIHLIPFFGPDPVRSITKADVEAFKRVLVAKGLAPKSVVNYLGTLSALMEFAIDQDWAEVNPVRKVRKPVVPNADDIRFLTVEEVEALVRAVPDDDLGEVEAVMYRTAAMTGLRQGELLGLRWRDISWASRRVRVIQNYVRGEFTSPKSGKGRDVPLGTLTARELDRLHRRQEEWTRARDRRQVRDDDLVFAHPLTGKPIDRSRLLKRYKATLRRAGLRDTVRFHDLRHTFATRMAGHPKVTRVALQALMGHADYKTTEIYASYQSNPEEATWVDEAFTSDAPGVPDLDVLADAL